MNYTFSIMEKLADIRLTGLRTLNCVIELGTLSVAAEHLGITPSAVSKQITRLEDDIGVRLLERSTRKVRPTDAGFTIYNKTRSLLDGLSEALDSVLHDETSISGVVRISATPAFGSRQLLSILAALGRDQPLLNFEVSLSDKRVDFFNDEFDLAIREGMLEDSNLRARLVGATRIVFCASPHYLKVRGAPKIMGDLAKHDVLTIPKSGPLNHPSRWMDKHKELRKLVPRIVINDLFAIRDLVIEGAGVAGLPDYVVAQALEKGEVIPVLPNLAQFELPINVVFPSNRHIPLRVRLVIDALSQDAW